MARLLAHTALVFSLALAGCGDDDPTSPPSSILLTSGTALTNVSGALNSETLYRIPVTAGATQLQVTTAGGEGDVELVVRRGSVPEPQADNACELFGFDNDEDCVVSNPAAGDWYILLLGSEAYSGVTLTATVTRP